MSLSVVRGQRAPTDTWTVNDAAMAAAYLTHLGGLCKGCGHPLEESTSDGADPENHFADQRTHKYVPEVSVCYACACADEQFKELQDDPNTKHFRAKRVATRRVDM